MNIRLAAGNAQYRIDHVTTNLMKHRRNEFVAMHRHPVFHLIYALEGKAKITVEGTTTTAEPGALYIINPNESHSFLFGDGEPFTDLECTFRLLDERGKPAEVDFFRLAEAANERSPPESLRAGPLQVPGRYKPLLSEGFERILELSAGSALRGRTALMVADLLARIELVLLGAGPSERPPDPTEALIERAKEYLHANRGRAVTLRETADFAHVTPNYLCRIFKERTGETPMGHLQAHRMREAEKLLLYTDLPVYAIAGKLGYEEASYFARVFRRTIGESPLTFRRRFLSENRITSSACRRRS